MLATLAEIEEQVIAIRGLPAADIGAPELLTRDELQDALLALFEEDYPPEEQAEDNASLRALGLLEPGQDIAALQLQLLGGVVLGFYDDDEKRMVVVTDQGLNALAKFTYAHEYTHALQDAAFGIASLERDAEGEDDRALARTALLEGDATVATLAWAFANLEPQELAEITSAPQPDTTGIPSWLIEQIAGFPYNEGYLWAGALAGDPLSPDFTELDDAYAEPPDSTEQIIDTEKWDPREEPIRSRDPTSPPHSVTAGPKSTTPRSARRSWRTSSCITGSRVTRRRPRPRDGAATASWSRRAPTTPSPLPGAWCGTRPRMRTNSRTRTTPSSPASASRRRSPGSTTTRCWLPTAAARMSCGARSMRPGTDDYIASGAEIPSSPSALDSTDRVASTRASRAAESSASSVSTLQSR